MGARLSVRAARSNESRAVRSAVLPDGAARRGRAQRAVQPDESVHPAAREDVRRLRAGMAVRRASVHRRARAPFRHRGYRRGRSVLAASSSLRRPGPRRSCVHTASAGAPTCGGVAIAKPTGGTWACTADDEFSGTALDTTTWTPLNTAVVGNHPGQECDDPNALRSPTVRSSSARRGTRRSPSAAGIRPSTTVAASRRVRADLRSLLDPGDVPGGQGLPTRILDAAEESDGPAGYSYGEIDVAESYSYKPGRREHARALRQHAEPGCRRGL